MILKVSAEEFFCDFVNVRLFNTIADAIFMIKTPVLPIFSVADMVGCSGRQSIKKPDY